MRPKKIEATEKAIGGRGWWDIFERICEAVLWPKHFTDYRHTPVYLCREVPSPMRHVSGALLCLFRFRVESHGLRVFWPCN